MHGIFVTKGWNTRMQKSKIHILQFFNMQNIVLKWCFPLLPLHVLDLLCVSNFCCAQMLFAEMERLSAPLEGLVHLGGLIHLVEGVSMSPLRVMVYRTVLVALMK